MHFKLLFFFVMAFFISCASDDELDDASEKFVLGQPVRILDQSPPLAPLDSLPEGIQNNAWVVTKNTPLADRPSAPPQKPIELYIAAKNYDGVAKRICVVFGDITDEKVDVIVNDANEKLSGGLTGIDGAIHQAASINNDQGLQLRAESAAYLKEQGLSTIAPGSAMATNSYGLSHSIKFVVHALGPDGNILDQRDLILYSAVYNSLLKAHELNALKVSLPAISAEDSRYPISNSRNLFFKAALKFMDDYPTSSIKEIRFTNSNQQIVLQMQNEFMNVFSN